MLPKKDARQNWRVLALNVAVVAAFGLVALSLPYLTNDKRAASGTSGEVRLVCRLVKAENPVADYYYWQVYQVQGGQVVQDWAAIYQEFTGNAAALVVSQDLQITKDGLLYTGSKINDFTGWARYQGQQVTVRL